MITHFTLGLSITKMELCWKSRNLLEKNSNKKVLQAACCVSSISVEYFESVITVVLKGHLSRRNIITGSDYLLAGRF